MVRKIDSDWFVWYPANAYVFPVVASLHPKSKSQRKTFSSSGSQVFLFGWREATTGNTSALALYWFGIGRLETFTVLNYVF